MRPRIFSIRYEKRVPVVGSEDAFAARMSERTKEAEATPKDERGGDSIAKKTVDLWFS